MSTQAGTLNYYNALQQQAQLAVQSFNTTIVPIQYPQQGDFDWNYQNPNQVFNSGTFDYISANVRPSSDFPGTAQLSSSGGFPNAYIQVIAGISYALSKADTATVNAAQSNASVQAATIVSDYQSTFGPITDDNMKAAVAAIGAVVQTKQDYVVSYILGYVWSGAQTSKQPPLSYTTMAAARNLKSLLPAMPMSGNQVVADTSIYLSILNPANAIISSQQLGAWILAQLVNNTSFPSSTNGGMSVVNPQTGIITNNQVGYSVNTSLASIQNDLQSTNKVITLQMSTSASTDNTLNVSVAGQTGVSVGSFLNFSATTKVNYDMNKTAGTSSSANVEISYIGYSMVPVSPLAWQQATNVGWFYSDPIAQAIQNGTNDVTGYKFVASAGSKYNLAAFADGGTFGYLDYLLVSNVPTVKITYSNADYATFMENWSTQTTGNLSLFGCISLGSFSAGASGSTVTKGADNSTFTVTFGPSAQVLSVPQMQQTAFVIGGGIQNP